MPRCVFHNLHLAITKKSVMSTPGEKTEIVNIRRKNKLLPQTPEEIAKRQKINDQLHKSNVIGGNENVP